MKVESHGTQQVRCWRFDPGSKDFADGSRDANGGQVARRFQGEGFQAVRLGCQGFRGSTDEVPFVAVVAAVNLVSRHRQSAAPGATGPRYDSLD
jgi:hypothetical protein